MAFVVFVVLIFQHPSSPEFQSSQVTGFASTSWVFWSVYISVGDSIPVNSCIIVLTLLSSRFLDSGVSSSALPRSGELLREFLNKRNAMKDRRATSRAPNEIPTPIPSFAD